MTNTYEHLMTAARALRRVELLGPVCDQLLDPEREGVIGLSDEECKSFLEENHEQLIDARRALAGPCHVPLKYSADYERRRDEDAPPLSRLAWSFALGLAASERSGHLAEAVRLGLDILGLSNAARRGGIIIDAFGSYGLASIGFDPLRRLRHRLNADDSLVLSAELLRIDAEREAWDDIAVRDEGWKRRVPEASEETAPFSGRSTEQPDHVAVDQQPIDPGDAEVDQEAIKSLMKHVKSIELIEMPSCHMATLYRQQDNRELALLRLLAIESALSAFRLKHGSDAADLHALIPQFLTALPLDPFSERRFRCQKPHDRLVAYSVGPHGNDCGGRFGTWSEVEGGEADLCLDLHDYDAREMMRRDPGRSTVSILGRLKSLIHRFVRTRRKRKG